MCRFNPTTHGLFWRYQARGGGLWPPYLKSVKHAQWRWGFAWLQTKISTFVFHQKIYYDVIIFADVDDVIKNTTKNKNPISNEPLIVWKWLTPRWKGIIKVQSIHEDSSMHYADFLLTSALFRIKIWKLRHVTSRDVTISDFHQSYRKCSFHQH